MAILCRVVEGPQVLMCDLRFWFSTVFLVSHLILSIADFCCCLSFKQTCFQVEVPREGNLTLTFENKTDFKKKSFSYMCRYVSID